MMSNNQNTKVYIDPSSQIIYSSFYIKGLYDFFGRKNVSFSNQYFFDLNKNSDEYSYDAYMAFVIKEDEIIYKIVIDFGDDSPIRENAYKWCNAYAKININTHVISADQKVISIAPSFGIKVWNVFEIMFYSLSNLVKLRLKPNISIGKYFQSYFSQLKALRLKEFLNSNGITENRSNYVFFIASLWPHTNCLTGTNLHRKFFLEACQRSKVNIEGGFVARDKTHPQLTEFKGLIIDKRIKLGEYVAKTKKSAFVFNTPAVHNCHGWKLGQFLAMNKAIISMPFENALPEDMVHGKNIHFVSETSDLETAIEKLLNDSNYRANLESGALDYYNKHVKPVAIIKKIYKQLKA